MSKNVRVKVFKNNSSPDSLDVYISQRNVSDYEGNISIKLFTTDQFVELENGASSGCPDVKGHITYQTHKVNFASCNPSLTPTWFSLTGKDGKEQQKDFPYADNTWDALIDEVKFRIVRIPDGDGCILFEMYVGE